MATKVFMEALSPTMEEGRITSWLKAEGDQVSTGDVLAEVETDKAVMELQARADGVLRKVFVGEGETTEVGKIVAVIAGADEDISDVATEAGNGKKKAEEAAEAGEAEERPSAGPPVRRSAGESGPPVRPSADADGDRIKASPLARRMAREQGLELGRIEGSGPGGRIIKRDVVAASPASPASPVSPAPVWGAEGWEDIGLSQMRKTIAKRLGQSIGPIPHFFLTAEIDMERVADARETLNAAGDETRISFNDIVIKVVAMALKQHRACNAWWQDDHIRYWNDVHVGMAVAVDEGLITPVLRHADRKSLRAISTEARELAGRAREKKLKPDEYTGATFSISNLGMFGIDQFTAVINPPEAGILAVGSVTPRPVAVPDGAVQVRRRMRVTMSCDHRVIDGATGARFLQTVTRMLENPLAIVW